MKLGNTFKKVMATTICAVTVMSSVGALEIKTNEIKAYADDVVTYDLNSYSTFKDRTKDDIAKKYVETMVANKIGKDIYVTSPNFSNPYSGGELKQEAHDAMVDLQNYYRWLEGAPLVTSGSSHSEAMQAGAVVRRYDFNHSTSQSKMPADMSDDFYKLGAGVSHNILAFGYGYTGAITGWLNEGFSKSSGKMGTIGHRQCLLSYKYTGIQFGYAGNVAIGKYTKSDGKTDLPFVSFPSAGYFPDEILGASGSSWSVELNRAVLKYKKLEDITVTVTDKSSGSSYTCTYNKGNLDLCWDALSFEQPTGVNGKFKGNYNVKITGMIDVATNKSAIATYDVSFFNLKEIIPGTWRNTNGKWWYEYADGSYATNTWKLIDGEYYYFDYSGYMVTGWKKIDKIWYYFDNSGAMTTGWVNDNGTWYYMDGDGSMYVGWLKDGGKWYYMDNNGVMQTGWMDDGGIWYYMNSSGAMQTDWVNDGGTWYYMNGSGAMQTGWIMDGGKWYYLYSSGAMAHDTVIDGYTLNSSGAWIN